MTDRLPATSYAVLGMLSMAPMSGYELAQSVDKTIAHFWTISKSQVYGELARLEELGLVTGTDVSQEGLPDKRTYEITTEGGEALDAWLVSSADEYSRLRSVPLLKMFFAHRLSREDVDELLERHRAGAEAGREQLEAIVGLLQDIPEATFARATAVVGLRISEGTVGALDEIKQALGRSRPRRRGAAVAGDAARELFRRTPARRRRGA